MVHSTLSTGLFTLTLLPYLISSSQDNQHHKKESIHKISHELSLEITVHGVLLWVSMGFLMPVGILVIRMANREKECRRRLNIIFYIHSGLQVLAAAVATVGAILSIKNFENSFSNTHQRMGLTLYGVIWLQALIGFLRPQRGSRGRSLWFVMHWLTGTTMSVLGLVNVYTGLKAYHKRTSTSTRLWTIIFTLEVSLLAFVYLLQDKWDYVKKQGVVLGSEPVRPTDQEATTSPTDKPKELPLAG